MKRKIATVLRSAVAPPRLQTRALGFFRPKPAPEDAIPPESNPLYSDLENTEGGSACRSHDLARNEDQEVTESRAVNLVVRKWTEGLEKQFPLIRVEQSNHGRRRLIATRDIFAGQEIISEKAFLKFRSSAAQKFKLKDVPEQERLLVAAICEVYVWARRVYPSTPNPLECVEFQVLSSQRTITEAETMRLRETIYPHVKKTLNFSGCSWYTENHLVELYRRLVTNSYGHGMYKAVGLFHHSCYPNACFKPIQTKKGLLSSDHKIVAVTDIKMGEQLFLAYNEYEGFPLEVVTEDFQICCQNKPDDFEATLACACMKNRSREAVHKIYKLSC